MKAREEANDRGWHAEWHHQLDGHEFKQVSGVSDGQGSLTCCSPLGHKVRHDWVTELN